MKYVNLISCNLHLTDHRIYGHVSFRAAEKERKHLVFARVPSFRRSAFSLVRHKDGARRARHLLRHVQLPRPRLHVSLLRSRGDYPTTPTSRQVFVVESMADADANRPIRRRLPPFHPTARRQLVPISDRLHLYP